MSGSTKLKLRFAAGFAILLAITVGVIVRNFTYIDVTRQTDRAHVVIEKTDLIAFNVKSAENDARRFASTGNLDDLQGFRDSLRVAADSQRELVRETSENTLQHRNAVLIGQLIADKARALEASNASVTPATLGRAIAEMDRTSLSSQLRQAFLSTREEERRVLGTLAARQDSMFSSSRIVTFFATLCSFSLILLSGWRMSVDFTRRTLAEQKLATRDEQYRQVIDLAGDIIYRLDEQGRFSFCNHAALSMLSFTEAEVIGRPYRKLIRPDKRRETERFYLRQLLRKQKTTYHEILIVDGHGRERWIGQNVQLIMEAGVAKGFQAIARDITERKRAELELQKSRNFIERIAATTPGVLYVYDLNEQRTVFTNREIVSVLGYNPEENTESERGAAFLVHPDDQPMIKAHYETMRQSQDGEVRRLEYRARHQDGHWVWLSGRETPFERGRDNRVSQVVGILQDITARKAAQDKLAWQANYDALTGLPNRHYFWTRMQSSLRRGSIDYSASSLCLFDIDRFKDINDRFGHAAGDEVLEMVGNIVRGVLRATDVAGRLGGDEFCFLLPGTSEDEAARVAERIRERLSTLAFGMDSGSAFSVTATFGVAASRPDINAKELMEAADRALYRAKSAGRNRVCVDA